VRRAAHAALGIQRAMRDLSREIEARPEPAIRMRIDLSTGPVGGGRIARSTKLSPASTRTCLRSIESWNPKSNWSRVFTQGRRASLRRLSTPR
jgi:hypothetical protein